MNKKAKCCALMIVFALVVTLMSAPAGASDDTDLFSYKTGNATINVSGLNLRSGPGTDFTQLASLGKSQAVKIVGQVGEWYAVYDYNSNQVGFVNGNYITIVSEDSKNDPKVPDEENPNAPGEEGLPESASDDVQRVFSLVNNVRQEAGTGKLEFNAELSKVAQDKAMDMVVNNYFSHQSPTYGTPFEMMKTYGIEFTAAAENIAGNQTMDGAFYAWMNSEGHKANIMNGTYTQTGIGVYTSPIYGKIIVQLFMK